MALTQGDIAFISFNADEDGWSIVTFVDIDPNTIIYFTDNEASSLTTFNTGESYFQWNSGANTITAGTVIRFSAIDNATNLAASIGAFSRVSVSGSSNYGLSATNETIYAYLGTSADSPTVFLSGISNDTNAQGTTDLTTAGLTIGTNAILLNSSADYGVYNGARSGESSFANYKLSVNNVSNWTVDTVNGNYATTVPDTTNFAIASGNPTVNLAVNTNSATEADTTEITVTATASSAVSGNQTVNLGVTGTNITAEDYSLSNTVITILDGQTTGSVTFTVVDDVLVEGTETATLTISNPSADIGLGTTVSQNITIADNDIPAFPIVNLSVSTSTGLEANTTAITVTATASSAVSGNQTVSLGVSGTGITTGDYYLTNNIITIPSGQTSGSVTFIVADDAIAEVTETAILTIATPSAGIILGSTTSQNITITNNNSSFLQKVGGFTSTNGAEISAFDSGSDRLFVIATSTIEIYDVSNTGTLTLAGSLTTGFTPPAGTQAIPNSVAVKNGIVAVAYAIQNTTTNAQQTGQVSFYNAAGTFLNSVAVGALPDMLTFTPDGTKVLVANEGEPNSYGQANSVDPEGSVSIIDVSGGVASATVTQATFTSFNSQIDALKAAGVRITGPGSTVAQDLEPEYIAVSSDGKTAWITLQENNAIAILDIASATITDILPLGTKNYNLPGNGLDASDRDGGINIQNAPVFGLYQPDAIASFSANGQTYYITANEGDSRDYTGFSEEIRVGAAGYVLDSTAFPNAATLKQNTNLGRLAVTNATGDTDGDGDFDRIESFGARSFSIWDASGNQIFDSGDQFEQITATKVPTLFNSDGAANTFDTRSDNKGPEPEGVAIGAINNRTYAFIGLERTGDVIVYEVTNPNKPSFVQYINTPEDVAIEGVTFVSAADSPTGKPLLVTTAEVSKTVSVFEVTPSVRISDIQGTAHISPLRGQTVSNVAGIVTVIRSNGFYLQDPTPDNNDRTSEGIFVFTSSAPTVQVGDSLLVGGTVSEFRPGNNANNLTNTQITSPTIVKLSSGNALPTATILGDGGRTIPTSVIDNDTTGNIETGTTTFDPAQDGIDFYESLEGMLVQVNNPVAVSPTNSFGEIWVLADNGANATGRTARGGIVVSPNDFNPERIQIDDTLLTGSSPKVNVGATLDTITGVVDYNFSNYEVLPTSVTVTSNTLTREVTNLTPTNDQLTIATFNVENLDPGDGATKFNNLAYRIVNNLKSPDIISLEEIQDNNGATNDSVVDVSLTFQTLIDVIAAAGGPTYQYRQINPVDDTNGGEPGGNIRVGFLFNPDRVSFVDTPGGTSTSNTTVTEVEGVPSISASPGLIEPTNSAFTSSRKPLVGQFTFNGQTVYVIGNHFNSKGGDQPLYGPNQPPTLSSEAQRQEQATLVKNFVESILAIDPNANVVVAGDLNDFEFSNPITTLESAGLTSLIETLPENERYTYNFQGNAQTLDHILVSSNLLTSLDGYDVVHINSEFADQDSDHDPSLARFNLPANQAPTAVADTVNIAEDATTSNLYLNLLSNDTDPNQGDTKNIIAVDTTGTKGQVSFNQNTQNLTYTASSFDYLSLGQTASDSFTYAIADSKGLQSTAIVSVTVAGVNDAPTVVQPIDDQIISTNKSFSFNISNKFADIDQADTLSYSATGLPTGSSIVANTGVISGTVSQVGIFAVTVTANDDKGGNVSDTFDLTVANNQATTGNDIIFVSELTGLNQYIVNALAGSDRVIGTNTSELINGGTGNDYIDGKGGIDILLGGDGNDTIFGGLGSDIISGGNGSDRLTGWGGGTNEIDLLNGDQGADTYVLGDATSVFYASSGKRDYANIVNFQASDRIEIKGVAANYSLGSASAVSLDKSAVGIFTNNGTELIAVVENGLNRNTNLATDTRFVFV
ncbi:choice-of-anchor I family protein [Nostoc sp. UHCC 0252]|uniref:choice-of-anchor I family protein n=1 Tax=Nostoc sp. UHCC 0252 TaxID=3110241 RepID=UPI002B1F930A|nr:choice-of-anchor I family protein [Nostoc sp. UHCC 0252]MEA5601280.1 choice-of-anchor I family protein [Nostoc sp. UHCC 0252]